MIVRKIPIITIIILMLNIVGLLYEYKVGQQLAIILYGMAEGSIQRGAYLRLIVSAFLHADIVHFASNMICLIIYGFALERRIGAIKFLLIYAVSIIGASVLINYAGGNNFHIGASGAIWGLMTATLVYNLNHNINPAYALRGIITNLLYSFNANISWQGHIGGGIAGLIVALLVCGNGNFSITAKEKEQGE